MTPYELRFEVFKQAYNMLADKYHAEFAEAEHMNGGNLPSNFNIEYPSLKNVLYQAKVINEFISENN
jgi:hypothetical protein